MVVCPVFGGPPSLVSFSRFSFSPCAPRAPEVRRRLCRDGSRCTSFLSPGGWFKSVGGKTFVSPAPLRRHPGWPSPSRFRRPLFSNAPDCIRGKVSLVFLKFFVFKCSSVDRASTAQGARWRRSWCTPRPCRRHAYAVPGRGAAGEGERIARRLATPAVHLLRARCLGPNPPRRAGTSPPFAPSFTAPPFLAALLGGCGGGALGPREWNK